MLITAVARCTLVCARVYFFPHSYIYIIVFLVGFFFRVYPPLPGAADNENRAVCFSVYRRAFGRPSSSSLLHGVSSNVSHATRFIRDVPLSLDEILILDFASLDR